MTTTTCRCSVKLGMAVAWHEYTCIVQLACDGDQRPPRMHLLYDLVDQGGGLGVGSQTPSAARGMGRLPVTEGDQPAAVAAGRAQCRMTAAEPVGDGACFHLGVVCQIHATPNGRAARLWCDDEWTVGVGQAEDECPGVLPSPRDQLGHVCHRPHRAIHVCPDDRFVLVRPTQPGRQGGPLERDVRRADTPRSEASATKAKPSPSAQSWMADRCRLGEVVTLVRQLRRRAARALGRPTDGEYGRRGVDRGLRSSTSTLLGGVGHASGLLTQSPGLFRSHSRSVSGSPCLISLKCDPME